MSETFFKVCRSLVVTVAVAHFVCLPIGAQVSKEVLDSISTPDQVDDVDRHPRVSRRSALPRNRREGLRLSRHHARCRCLSQGHARRLPAGAHQGRSQSGRGGMSSGPLLRQADGFPVALPDREYLDHVCPAEPRSRAGWSDGPRGAGGHARRLQRCLVPLRPGRGPRRPGQGTRAASISSSRPATKARCRRVTSW